MVKRNSEFKTLYDVETGKPVVVIEGVENYDRAKQIANAHFKVSVGLLTVCYAKTEEDGSVTYDVAKKDANAVAVIKEGK